MPETRVGEIRGDWTHVGEIDGRPIWRRAGEATYVAAADMDQLLFIDAALRRFDRMEPQEFEEFIAAERQSGSPDPISSHGSTTSIPVP